MPSRCRGRHLPTSDIFRNDRLIRYTSSFSSSTKTPRERRTSRIYPQNSRSNRGFVWTLIAAVLLFLVFEAKLIEGSRKHIARTEVDLVSRFRLERLAKSSYVTYEGKTATFRKGTRVVKPLRRLRLWELLSTSAPGKESDISPLSIIVSLQPDNITQTYYLFTLQDAKKRMQLGVKIFRDHITLSFKGHRRTFSLTVEDAGQNTTANTSSKPTSFAFLFEDGRITFYHNCGAKRETRDIPEFQMKSFINGSTDAKTKIILGRRRGENTAFVGRMCQFTLHRGAEAAQNFCNFLRRRCRRNNPRHGVPKAPTNTIYSGAATSSDQDSHFNPPNKDIGATPRDINEDVRWGSGDDPEPPQTDSATLSRTVISNDSSIEFSSTSAYFNPYQSHDFSSRRFQTRIFHPILASPRSRRADATASAAATRGRTGVIRFQPGVAPDKKSPKNKTAPTAGDRTSLSDSIKSPTSSAIFEDPLLFITDMHTVSPRGGTTLKENSRQSSIKSDSVGTISPVATSKSTSEKESSQDQSTTTVYDPLSSIQSHEQTSTFSSQQTTDSFPSLVPNLLSDDVTVRDSVVDHAPIGDARQDGTTDSVSTNEDIDPLFIVPKLQTISPGGVISRDSNQDDISNADGATIGDAPQDMSTTTVTNQPNAQGTHTSSKQIVTDPLFVIPKLQPLRPGDVTVSSTTATLIGGSRQDEKTTPSASVEEGIQTDIPTTAATVEYLTTPEPIEITPLDEEDLSDTETTTALPDDDQYRTEESNTTSSSNITKTVEITIGQMTYNIPTWVSNYVFCKNETSGGKATLYLCGLVGPKGESGTRVRCHNVWSHNFTPGGKCFTASPQICFLMGLLLFCLKEPWLLSKDHQFGLSYTVHCIDYTKFVFV